MISVMVAGSIVLLAVGVLIGSGLHTRAVDRRYWRVARLVRELYEREEALARSDYLREPPLLTLPPVTGEAAGRPAEVPHLRGYHQ